MKMPKINGYEYTGEFRIPDLGETYWSPMDLRIVACQCRGVFARPILRKVEVWKPLTLEKALEMGKFRREVTFRINSHSQPFSATVDYIDFKPATRSNVRLGHYGWAWVDDLEYLED